METKPSEGGQQKDVDVDVDVFPATADLLRRRNNRRKEVVCL